MRGWRMATPLVFAAAGLVFAASAQTARGTDLRSDELSDLSGLIATQNRRVQDDTARVAALRRVIERRTHDVGGARAQAAVRRAAALAGPAGLRAVRGPGVTVTLDDAPLSPAGHAPSDVDPDALVVHQQDVQAVVNALWAGGAEALQLMDQRVISTSAVRCVGNTLILQGRVYSPPYAITAIGNPTRMESALAASRDVRIYLQYVDAYGLGYRLTEHHEIRIPAFTGSLELRYAQEAS
jgi:uncharacterized protein YlxW (UPF0749 family)